MPIHSSVSPFLPSADLRNTSTRNYPLVIQVAGESRTVWRTAWALDNDLPFGPLSTAFRVCIDCPASLVSPFCLSALPRSRMLITNGGTDSQQSAGLSLNLSSNNPFRNRAASPASPFDEAPLPPRPVSRNPFLDQPPPVRSPDSASNNSDHKSLTAEEIFVSSASFCLAPPLVVLFGRG